MSTSANNREDEPCGEDEHKFQPEYYDLAYDDTSALDCCCTYCGWSVRDLQEIAPICSAATIERPYAGAVGTVRRCRRANHHDGPHGASDLGPFFDTSSRVFR